MRVMRAPYGMSIITDGQRKFLEECLLGPVIIGDGGIRHTADIRKRLAEQMQFKGWVKVEGHISSTQKVTITEKGRQMLDHPTTKKLYRRKISVDI